MKLAQYLSDRGITQTAFAALMKVSQPTINRYALGERFPDRDMIWAIELATDGQVTPADWYADDAAPDEAAA